MARKKRLPKRKASPKKKRSDDQNCEPLAITSAIHSALEGLPRPARAIAARVDDFGRAHPKIYEIITRDVDSPYYREKFERHIEREQAKRRRKA